MLIKEIELSEYEKYFEENINSYKENKTILYNNLVIENLSDRPKAIYNPGTNFNKQYCKNQNIELVNTQHCGGCIVVFPGDMVLGHYDKHSNFIEELSNRIETWLQNKLFGNEIRFDNNDLLINGKKILGMMRLDFVDEEHEFSGLFLSYQSDIDIIKNVCTKKMEKEPIGLKEFGIEKEEIKEFIIRNIEEISNGGE